MGFVHFLKLSPTFRITAYRELRRSAIRLRMNVASGLKLDTTC